MPSIVDRIKHRVSLLKPRVSTCILYARPLPLIADERPDAGPDFEFKIVTDPTDRHLAQIETPQRLARAGQFFARGGLVILAIHTPTDRAIGKIWLLTRSADHSDGLRGVLPVKLAKDEAFLLDLWVHKDFRRQMVAFTMAFELGAAADQLLPDYRWVYGYAHKDNKASRAVQEMLFGMWPVQEFTEIEWGTSFVTKVPFSDKPRFGPFSRRGRHSGDGFRVGERPRGEGYRAYHHPEGFMRAKPLAPSQISDGWFWPGPDWFDTDHPLDHEGRPATPESLPRTATPADRVSASTV